MQFLAASALWGVLTLPAMADQTVNNSQWAEIFDDCGSTDELFGFAQLTVSDDGTMLDAYADAYMVRYDPNPGVWGTLLEVDVYVNSQHLDHGFFFNGDGFGGDYSYENYFQVQPGNNVIFNAQYGVMNTADDLYYEILANSYLTLTVQSS